MKKLLILLLLISTPCFAEDVATYSGSVYTGCRNIGNTSIWLSDPNDYGTVKSGYIYLPNGCQSLPQVDAKFLKQVGGAIVEMSQAEKDAIILAEAQALEASLRSIAKSQDDGLSSEALYRRAIAQTLLDEINSLRQWITDFKAQVALASSLNDLKTRVAALPNVPSRTLAQAKNAIESKIDDKSLDNS